MESNVQAIRYHRLLKSTRIGDMLEISWISYYTFNKMNKLIGIPFKLNRRDFKACDCRGIVNET